MMEPKARKEHLSVILVLLVQSILTSEAIKCYKCISATYVYSSNDSLLCKDFDYSEKFIEDCPYSTFCVKQNSHAQIQGEQINGTDRNCASQKLDTQKLVGNKWYAETIIEEPYTEGCKINQDKGLRTASVEHCYCRGDLCNSGNNLHGASDIYHRTIFMSIIGILLFHRAVKLTIL